jgi:hypothetical protein
VIAFTAGGSCIGVIGLRGVSIVAIIRSPVSALT